MGNGKWEVRSEKWEVRSGKWEVGSEEMISKKRVESDLGKWEVRIKQEFSSLKYSPLHTTLQMMCVMVLIYFSLCLCGLVKVAFFGLLASINLIFICLAIVISHPLSAAEAVTTFQFWHRGLLYTAKKPSRVRVRSPTKFDAVCRRWCPNMAGLRHLCSLDRWLGVMLKWRPLQGGRGAFDFINFHPIKVAWIHR